MNKKRTAKQYAVALYELGQISKNKNLDAALKKFVEILARDRRLKKADNIIAEYEKYSDKQAGITPLTVYSSRALPKGILDKINTAFGGKTKIIVTEQPELLGGIKIKTDDKILDASLLKQLQILKRKLS